MKKSQELEIFDLLCKNYSYWAIINHFKLKKVKVSKCSINLIKKKYSYDKENFPCEPKKPERRGRPLSLTNRQVSNLKKEVLGANPKSQKDLGDKYEVHQTTIGRYIKRNFKLKRTKKRKVHFLSEKQCARRFQSALRLYRFLRENLSKIISTDEKLFHLTHAGGQKSFFYKKRGDYRRSFAAYEHHKFPKCVMVWGGISMRGKTKLRFVTQGVKINSEHYQKNILSPFISEDLKNLYPDGDGILQQDSAPAHVSKNTLEFMSKRKMKFIPPDMWTPNSPDNAPLDFNIWGWMEKELQKRKVYTIIGLKRALQEIWDSISQEHIDRVLKHWLKRCRLIHENEGKSIEHLIHLKKRSSSK